MKLGSAFFYPHLKQTILLTTGIIILTVSGTASANRITLVVTSNQQSILSPATWAVFTVKDKERKAPIATLPRHSGTVILPAGQYLARVQIDQQSRETAFWVESNVDRIVNISLD